MQDITGHASRVTKASVYILSRVAEEIMAFCQRRLPNEALGMLLGRRCQHGGHRYVRVTDWVTGSLDASPVHAEFTPQGVAECHAELAERYGPAESRPQAIGIFHSHPFGGEPLLSPEDQATFGCFPYNAEGNVFVLINPRTGHFLVFQRDSAGALTEQEWVEYAPQAPHRAASGGR